MRKKFKIDPLFSAKKLRYIYFKIVYFIIGDKLKYQGYLCFFIKLTLLYMYVYYKYGIAVCCLQGGLHRLS